MERVGWVPLATTVPLVETLQASWLNEAPGTPGLVREPVRESVCCSVIVLLAGRPPIATVGVPLATATGNVFTAVWPSLSVTVTSTM